MPRRRTTVETERSNTREHRCVRLPTIEKLKELGWTEGQMQWSPEWRVPKTPSEAAKRERGKSFEGFPCDLVLFASEEEHGAVEALLIIFELKQPGLDEGRQQLETLLSLEPRARMGYWSNGSESVAIYRRADGSFELKQGAPLPKPTDTFSLGGKKTLDFSDLDLPDPKELSNRLKRIFDRVVARDSIATRTEDQLRQLCNLLLVKLESDKLAKADQSKPLAFQPSDTEAKTATAINREYALLCRQQPDIFGNGPATKIDLDEHTIHEVVYELATTKLVDISAATISRAFQVFRSANLRAGEGQYFTPYRVIKSAVEFMEITPRDKVIDPACGTGGFLVETFLSLRTHYPQLGEPDLRTWAHDNLFGVDKDDISVKLARAIMLILGDGSANIVVGDSIRSHRWGTAYPHLSTKLLDGSFTCAITNPPFGRKLTVSARDGQMSGYTITRKGTDQHHDLELGLVFMERCHRLLMVGGRLGIILPETYFFSSTYEWLKGWMKDRLELRGMLNIPMEAFQAFCRAKTNFYVFEKVDDGTGTNST
jgi:type I restriction-modification system DNA methylase subunit